MNTSADKTRLAIEAVHTTTDTLSVDLTDGRTISVPLAWYPRLLYGQPEERLAWRLIGKGEGIHWPSLDEDISLEGIISGTPSTEKATALHKWMLTRIKTKKPLRKRAQRAVSTK